MLHLQAASDVNPDLRESLNEASSRISTVGRAYERLAYNADYEQIELVEYLREVLNDLEREIAPSIVEFDAPAPIQFAADRAILLALVVNELVVNASKYAYPDRKGGPISVQVVAAHQRCVSVSVHDKGVGLPADFHPETSKRLGSRLIVALSKQLNSELIRNSDGTGTHCTLLVPLDRSESPG
jgi:two-component sensor histidine kinase